MRSEAVNLVGCAFPWQQCGFHKPVPLSFFLSIYTGSLIHEHYTRECEFGNFDKIKNKNNTKKKTKKKHKNFWLNFCLNKECPKLLCGLGICHRRRQTIPMWNSLGEKGILQGITVCLMSAVLSTMWWPGRFQTVSRGHILSVSHRLKKGQGAGQKKGTFDAQNSPKRALLLEQTFQMWVR